MLSPADSVVSTIGNDEKIITNIFNEVAIFKVFP